MDLKHKSTSSVAIAVHTAASLREPQATINCSPKPGDGYTPPEIDQSHDATLVTKLLNRSYDCNGVCSEKILLWGLPGCGSVIPHPLFPLTPMDIIGEQF